jgi:hypothetical protein
MGKISSNKLAIERTKLANQRTYLAFLRTSIAISAVAGHFKKYYLFLFGILMLIISTVQYILLNYSLDNNKLEDDETNIIINYTIVIYTVLGLLILYLQYKK